MNEIERFQKCLLLLRRTLGWSGAVFGNYIGATRQTVNNIETGRNKLSKTRYIAMRSVLEAEIAAHPDETEVLRLILEVFVDNPDGYTQEQRESIFNHANMMAPSVLAGATARKDVSKAVMEYAATMGVDIGSSDGSWIAKSILEKK